MLPHHRPFTQMSLRQLAHYQRLTLDRDMNSITWWRTYRHSPRTLANGRTIRVSVAGFPYCLGGRMPREVCWHYHHRHWTRPLYKRTLARLQPARPATPWPAYWEAQALCVHRGESGDWHNRGYFRGGMQFLVSTWQSVGGRGDPADASPYEQLYRSYLLWKQQGWSPWPNTSRACGLR